MPPKQIVEADLTWIAQPNQPGRFEPGVRIAIDEAGMIAAVGALSEQPTRRLSGRAIIPGMVNAHSHAFQRGLRGLGETFPAGAGSFWTWREAMYQLVEALDEAAVYELSKQAFDEMLAAGVTTVGEFHYVHHDASLGGFAFDDVVLRAATDAGIRITLINTYYKTGGINKPLAGGQLRFRTDSLDAFWAQMEQLAQRLNRDTQSLAVAAHSIRAVPLDEIVLLRKEAQKRSLPFHMHVEEQPLEIEECLHAYNKPPMALINERLSVDPTFTAVHCTHTAAADMEHYLAAGGNVCINPLTEANLGDGIPAVRRILNHDGHIAFGSDSNARICWTEEMRWLEYVQRLRTISRGICVDEQGSVARKLFEMATVNGARCLGQKVGRIQPQYHADLVAIDLEARPLRGWTAETLLDSFIFGTGNDAIAERCVGGRWL